MQKTLLLKIHERKKKKGKKTHTPLKSARNQSTLTMKFLKY